MDELLFKILESSHDDDFEKFCYFFANKISGTQIVFQLLSISNTRQCYRCLSKLAWFYFVEHQGRNFGEEVHFELDEFSKSFQKYMYSWSRLQRKGIPFEKWSDLAKEGVDLLETLIQEGKLENFTGDPRHAHLQSRFWERHEELRRSGEYPDLSEFMDD